MLAIFRILISKNSCEKSVAYQAEHAFFKPLSSSPICEIFRGIVPFLAPEIWVYEITKSWFWVGRTHGLVFRVCVPSFATLRLVSVYGSDLGLQSEDIRDQVMKTWSSPKSHRRVDALGGGLPFWGEGSRILIWRQTFNGHKGFVAA